jgi:nucleotide-binding universal stress UspA family protein
MSHSTLRTALVPLDGSAHAEQALTVAARLRKHAGASPHLVMVEPPISVMAMDQEGSGERAMLSDELRAQLREYLVTTAEELSTTHGLRTHWALLAGWPPRSLAAYVHQHHIDLIVMTTHGRGGFSRFWLGSVADELLRRVSSPVLLFRPSEAPPTAFDRILIALDESADLERALEPSIALGRLTQGLRITLAQVVEPPSPWPSDLLGLPTRLSPVRPEAERKVAAARLEQLAKRLREGGLPVDVKVVIGVGVAGQILQLARSEGSNLVVVGTHGATGVERLLLGSVADKVVRGATQPVLVVPARTRAARPYMSSAERAELLAAGSTE